MKTFTAYSCDFCNTVFKEEDACISHEKNCSYDVNNKSCNTCAHFVFEYGNFTCKETGIYDFYDETLPNCPKWKLENE